jgi:hypothetical protein
MFRDHPNKNLKFKIKPLLREKLRVSGDMPSKNAFEVLKKIAPLFSTFRNWSFNRLDMTELEKAC